MSGSESGSISYVSAMAEEGDAAVAAPTAATVDMPLVHDIWSCAMVETFREMRKNKWVNMMRCLHCNEKFTRSATKLKYHLGQNKGGDIKICDSIPPEYKARYRHSIQEYFSRKAILIHQKHQEILDIENHVAAASQKYEKTMPVVRKRRGQSTPQHLRKQPIPLPLDDRKRKVSIPSSVGHSTSIASRVSAIGGSIDLTSADSPRRPRKKPKNTRQPSLSVPTANGVALMDVMVANFLQSNALPESLSDCPLLAAMIEQAHRVPLDYKPPTRQAIGSLLLDANYDTVMDKQYEQLNLDKYVFGLTMFGVST